MTSGSVTEETVPSKPSSCEMRVATAALAGVADAARTGTNTVVDTTASASTMRRERRPKKVLPRRLVFTVSV